VELALEELLKIDGSSYPKDERIKKTCSTLKTDVAENSPGMQQPK
jgi:hypothetical protein